MLSHGASASLGKCHVELLCTARVCVANGFRVYFALLQTCDRVRELSSWFAGEYGLVEVEEDARDLARCGRRGRGGRYAEAVPAILVLGAVPIRAAALRILAGALVADPIWRAFRICTAKSALVFDAEISVRTLGVEPTVAWDGSALAITTSLAERAVSSLSTLLAFARDAEFMCVTVYVWHAGWMARLASEQHRDDNTNKRDFSRLEQSGNEGLHLIDQRDGKKRAGTLSARTQPSQRVHPG
jgi:hypothetical protein